MDGDLSNIMADEDMILEYHGFKKKFQVLDLSMVVTLAAPRLSSHLGQVLLNLFFDSLGLKASTIAILTAASCCIFENDLHQRTNLSNLATPLLPRNLVL
jgi:hypothetical protein